MPSRDSTVTMPRIPAYELEFPTQIPSARAPPTAGVLTDRGIAYRDAKSHSETGADARAERRRSVAFQVSRRRPALPGPGRPRRGVAAVPVGPGASDTVQDSESRTQARRPESPRIPMFQPEAESLRLMIRLGLPPGPPGPGRCHCTVSPSLSPADRRTPSLSKSRAGPEVAVTVARRH
jgi:hypothetical protein